MAAPSTGLVGRDEPLARLRSVLERTAEGDRSVVLVRGEAGIGKTSLVRAATSDCPIAAWGTCVDDVAAPGYWPWTTALEHVVRRIGRDAARALAGDDVDLVAALVPSLLGRGRRTPPPEAGTDRLLLAEAVASWLGALAAQEPVVLVLDDLQWADDSSLALLEYVAAAPSPAALAVIGCYRGDELSHAARRRLAAIAARATNLELPALDREGVAALLHLLGVGAGDEVVAALYRRTGGHPVFTRELALLPGHGTSAGLPGAVHDVIERRLERLPEEARRLLRIASVAGKEVPLPIVARVASISGAAAADALGPAVRAGVVSLDGRRLSFVHDLYREAVAMSLTATERSDMHFAIGSALEERALAGDDEVLAADVARHFAAALASDGPERAARWALRAAEEERASFAFPEAAAHLRRWRMAVADAGIDAGAPLLCDVLLAEAGALAAAGSPVDARGLLRLAHDHAVSADDGARLARVALAVTDLGATFAARRDETVRELDDARDRLAGTDPALEAKVTAALARELQHSVAADRPRAGPLSERALEIGRACGDVEALHACLLARHDLLWAPGTAEERGVIATELVDVADQLRDDHRLAQGLLLLANALLEQGSAAFRQPVERAIEVLEDLRQPRARYIAASRRAALSLLAGDLDAAEEAVDAAAALGERVREPDTANVRMSQRLELVRARGDADELAAFAADAVAHWRGAPLHAHAVAAGFLARAGDLPAARQELAAVAGLGGWRTERTYLWSVFVRELAVAAVAVGDAELCRAAIEELTPLASTCGVNGAVVAFAGSHAHTLALLHEGIGGDGGGFRAEALATYQRLRAIGWAREVRSGFDVGAEDRRSFVRSGRTWEIRFDGERVTVPHSKGIADLAVLVSQPDRDVHVLDLVGSDDRSRSPGVVSDRQALTQYRRRLVELDDDLEAATVANDAGRRARLDIEREALLAELRRATSRHGSGRTFANYPAERARKAVAARIRDAIRRLEPEAPSLAAHLDAAVVTGVRCRYRGEGGPRWQVLDRADR